jgi:hypothetical protein
LKTVALMFAIDPVGGPVFEYSAYGALEGYSEYSEYR